MYNECVRICGKMYSLPRRDLLDILMDPVLLCTLEDPVLASDGYTYSFTALCRAMDADPWHRSPVTGEVLRPDVYSNGIAWELLNVLHSGTEDAPGMSGKMSPKSARVIFSRESVPPNTASKFVYHSPRRFCGNDEVTVTAQWRLPDEFSIVMFMHDGRVMHPPAAREAHEAVVALAKSLHLNVPNPECLAGAMLTTSGMTIEEHWRTNCC